MAWKFEYCTDGSTWIEIDNGSVPIESVRHTSQRHRDLKPSTDTFEFAVRFPTTAFLNAILSSNAFEFKSSLGGSAIFRGWVSSESKADVGRRLERIAVKAFDESWLLDTKIGSVINWQNYYIANSADTAHSIVHQLMLQYGLTLARITPQNDLTQIDYFVAEADETYDQLLTRLLFEFGWIYYFDADGTLQTEALFPDAPTAAVAFDVSNISQPMAVSRKPVQKDGVQVTYWAHQTILDAIVSSDTTDGDTVHKAYVSIAAGDYYPIGSGTNDVFTNLSVADRDLIVALNGTIESAYESGIVQSSPTWHPKKLLVNFNNTAGAARHLTQFDVIADAVVKGDKGILRVYNADELKADLSEFDARFLTTFAQSSYLASGAAQYYKFSSLSYLFRSRDAAAVGVIAQLTDTVSGISQLCRIYARATSWQIDGVAIHEYALEGIAAYSLQTIATEGEHSAPPPLPRPLADGALFGVMTKVEAITGFDSDGGTTTPTVPVIACAKGAGRNIAITWDRQLDLTNLSRYELQVSDINRAELIDRGDCESATPPAITPQTTVFVSAGDTWAQSNTFSYNGTNSYKFTKNSAAGTLGLANLVPLDSGFYVTPGHTYRLTARFRIPSGQTGLVPSTMLTLSIGDGLGGQPVFAQDIYDTFQLITWEHTVPLTATKAIPRAFATVVACPACIVYVDDITLTDVTDLWYSLQTDGTDWKDTLDADTDVPLEIKVHTLVPLLGDSVTPRKSVV